MATTRAAIVAHLSAWYDGPLEDADLAATDTAGNLAEVIDAALRDMGVADAELASAAPVDGAGFRLLAEYHALRRVVLRLQSRIDIGTDGDTFRLQQAYDNALKLLALAEKRVSGGVVTPPTVPRTGSGVGVLIPVMPGSELFPVQPV
jgi:hypothetical protein